MSDFTAIDLSALPAPQVIETPLFETLLAEHKAYFLTLSPDYATLDLESDPVNKLLQAFAYRETILRARVNDAAKSVLLAFASGTDLEHIAAGRNLSRNADETDAALRQRVLLAPEGYSTAGPEGAYIFHALNADTDVKNVSAVQSAPGTVTVTVLSKTGDGTAPQALLDTVEAALNAKEVRPLTDNVIVQGAAIINYTVTATLTFYDGPDRALVLAEAQAAIEALTLKRHAVGADVTRSAIFAALHREGVQNVTLTAPAADLAITSAQAGYCTGITLTDGGVHV